MIGRGPPRARGPDPRSPDPPAAPVPRLTTPSPLALVLSGGGARGAYEAGVLAFVRDGLPALRDEPLFDILCGTSVGALHTCYLAATAHEPSSQGNRLEALWRGLAADDVFAGVDTLVPTVLRRFIRLRRPGYGGPEAPLVMDGLLTTGNEVESTVRTAVDWSAIPRNIEAGCVQAVSVSATEILTGRTVIFVQQAEGRELPPWVRNPNVEVRPATLRPEHALASSAVPLVFQSVDIDGRRYCDGGLRQNTPLSPAVRLGAERLLVVNLHHLERDPEALDRVQRIHAFPGMAYLLGKLMDAVFLDHVDNDLDRLRQINTFLDLGEDAFGPDFIPRLNQAAAARRGARYRRIRELTLTPSQDIGILASRMAGSRAYAREARPLVMRLFELFTPEVDGLGPDEIEADLLSYLMFSPSYISALLELGYDDARRRREDLERFLTPGPA